MTNAEQVPIRNSNSVSNAEFIAELTEIAEFHGISNDSFADKLGLPLKTMRDPSVVFEKSLFFFGYNTLADCTGDELCGLGEWAQSPGWFAFAFKLAANEKNLHQALKAMISFNNVCNSSLKAELILGKKTVRLQLDVKAKEPRFRHFINRMVLGLYYASISLLVKQQLPMIAINMQRAQPNNPFDYECLFNNKIYYSQKNYELVFDRALLFKPVQCEYNDLKHTLKNPVLIIGNVQAVGGIVQQVKYILSKHPLSNFPSQESIAAELDISARTMQRKLTAENNSLKQLKNELRKQTALFHMQYTSKNITQIAEKCGYSERSAFVRAFIRWTGTPPSKFERTS